MTFANSSSVQVAYVEETVFGTTPGSGTTRALRVTGESLDYTISKTPSAEINSTRTISSQIPTTASATGGVNCEVSYKEYDPLIEGVFQSAFAVYGTSGVGAAFTAAFTATDITASVAPVGASAFTTLQKGQWFRVDAPSDVNDKTILRVSTTTAPTSTVITLDAATPATISASVANTTIATSRLFHGTTQKSYSVERQESDIAQFFTYKGMTLGTMDLSVSSGSLSSMNFGFTGKSAARATSTALPGAVTASQTYDIHSGVTGSQALVWIAGTYQAGAFVKSVSLKYDNTLRAQEAIGTLGSVAIASGTIAVTGSMEIYLADGALFDAFVANSSLSLSFSTVDTAGNGYVFTIPNANLGKATITAGSKDADMMISVDYTGLRDATNAVSALQKVIFCDRVGVAV